MRGGASRKIPSGPGRAYANVDVANLLPFVDSIKARAAVEKLTVEAIRKRYQDIWGVEAGTLHPVEFEEAVEALKKSLLAAIVAELYAYRRYAGIYKHTVISIVGPGGTAKSTFAFIGSVAGLVLAGMSLEEAKETVKRWFIRSLREMIEKIESLVESSGYTPVIILDDFSAFVPKYWLHMKMYSVSRLFSLLDILKDYCSVTIVTGRAFESIAKRVREISQIVVKMSEVAIRPGTHVILATYHIVNTDNARPSRTPFAIDVLPPTIKMPEDMWTEMLEDRRKLAKSIVEQLRESLEKEDGGGGSEGGRSRRARVAGPVQGGEGDVFDAADFEVVDEG